MQIYDNRPLACSKCDSTDIEKETIDIVDCYAIIAKCKNCGHRAPVGLKIKETSKPDELLKPTVYSQDKYRRF